MKPENFSEDTDTCLTMSAIQYRKRTEVVQQDLFGSFWGQLASCEHNNVLRTI